MELRFTWTLILVSLSYAIFLGPIFFADYYLIDQNDDINSRTQTFYLIILCTYFLQYSTNFLIYAIRSPQYRRACIFLWQNSKLKIGNALSRRNGQELQDDVIYSINTSSARNGLVPGEQDSNNFVSSLPCAVTRLRNFFYIILITCIRYKCFSL